MILKKLFRKRTDGRPRYSGEPGIQVKCKSYDDMLEEITQWNIENTRILEILRERLPEELLARWSEALSGGIRKKIQGAESSLNLGIYHEIYRFICHQRTSLLTEPSMKNARKLERTDPIILCIICGIRAIQKERDHGGLMDTIKFGLLERKFAKI